MRRRRFDKGMGVKMVALLDPAGRGFDVGCVVTKPR